MRNELAAAIEPQPQFVLRVELGVVNDLVIDFGCAFTAGGSCIRVRRPKNDDCLLTLSEDLTGDAEEKGHQGSADNKLVYLAHVHEEPPVFRVRLSETD